MQKINKSDLSILVKNMPESIRNIYDSGTEIKIKILRQKPLKRYGQEINLRIWRGMIIDTSLDEYEYPENIADFILGYFLYGEKSKIVMTRYHGPWQDCVWSGDYGIRFAI